MNNLAGIVLAAGLGSRFRAGGGDSVPSSKMLAHWHGKALVRWVAEAALAAGLDPVTIVLGHAADEVEAALTDLPVQFIRNADFATGLASSVKCGLAALPEATAGTFVLLGDMPAVDASLIRQLADAFAARPQVAAVVPVQDGRRGNPALIARRLFPSLALMSGDRGAGPILAAAGADVVEVPVSGVAAGFDIDTPEALAGSS
jgi:molybdenum cofactor cytidylyltransferase